MRHSPADEGTVYNAIDGEATSIAVRVHLQSYTFQVIDNGVGIQPADIPYVGKKHYTSKIFTVSDLRQPPAKYGYKGVTIAKLISVSETLTITSRYASEQKTWMKSYHKGKEDVKVVDDRVSKGTTVHIQGFLYNLKIQRQSINGPKELQDIKNFLERTSVLHSNISFSLRDDFDKSVLLGLHKSKDTYQAIQAAFGIDLRDEMYELEVKKNVYNVKAFISKMVSDVNLQLVFINGRLSVDSKLDFIAKNGFDKLIGNDIGMKATKTQKKNDIYPKAQGKLQYIIFLTCPYEVYQFDNRTQRTIIEFDHWEPIRKILDKLIMFYRETLNDSDKRKDDIVTYKDNDATVKERVGKIVSRILRSHKKKIGLSQVQNGIRGKVANRKKIKLSKQSKLKKVSNSRSNNNSLREQPQTPEINNQHERTPGDNYIQTVENKLENWFPEQNIQMINNNKQQSEGHLQPEIKSVDPDEQEIKDIHYSIEQKNMLTELRKTRANNKHDQFLSKETTVTKTLTRKIMPNKDIQFTQEHRNITIQRKYPRETGQNHFIHRDKRIKNYKNIYYCQDHIATKSVISKRDSRKPKANNLIQENNVISFISTVKTYESHCCDTHKKGLAINNRSKYKNRTKHQLSTKDIPILQFSASDFQKNLSRPPKFTMNVDLQRKGLNSNKEKSVSHPDHNQMDYSSIYSTKREINFDGELMQKKLIEHNNLNHSKSLLLYDYGKTGNNRKQGVICNRGESNNFLNQKYMSIDSTIRSKTSSLKLVLHPTIHKNNNANYCLEKNDFVRMVSPIYSNADFLACKRGNYAKDYNMYFNRGMNVRKYTEYNESPYFCNPNIKNSIDNRRLSKNFQFACKAINWASKEKYQNKSYAQIKSNPLDCFINKDVKLIKNDKCTCNTLGKDSFCSFALRSKHERGIPTILKKSLSYIEEPKNNKRKLISQNNVIKQNFFDNNESNHNEKQHIVTKKIYNNNLNMTYTVEGENNFNQEFISKDTYIGNDNQLFSSSCRLNPNTFTQFERLTQTLHEEPNEPTTNGHKRYPESDEIIFLSQECGRSSPECCFDPVTLCVPQLESSELFEESLHFENNSLNEDRNHHKNITSNSKDISKVTFSRYVSGNEIVNEKYQDPKLSHQSVRRRDPEYQYDDFQFRSYQQNDCTETDSGILYPHSYILSNKKNDVVHHEQQNNKYICDSSKLNHKGDNDMTNNQVASTTYIISEPLHTHNEFQTTEIYSDSKGNLHPNAILNSKHFINARIRKTSVQHCTTAFKKSSINTLLKTNGALNTITDDNKCWQEIVMGGNDESRTEEKLTPLQLQNNPFIIRKRPSYVPKGYSQLIEKRLFFTPALEPSQDYFNESVYEEFVDEVVRGEAVVRGAIGPETANCGRRGSGAGAFPHMGAVALDRTALAQAQVIGQVDRKFIALVVRGGGGGGARVDCNWLAMVDQHAAHERVRVHQLLREYKRGEEWVSCAVDGWEAVVGAEEAAALRCGKQLRALGLRWRQLGPHRARFTAVPRALLGHRPRDPEAVRSAAAALLREQARSLRQQRGAGDAHPPAIMRLLNSEACQSAIKFGQALSVAQCAALVQQLARCPLPFQCAHGRPTVALTLSLSDTPHHAYTVKTSQLLAFTRYVKEARIESCSTTL